MKTLQQCKDEFAYTYGYHSWAEMHIEHREWKDYASDFAEFYASQFREPSTEQSGGTETWTKDQVIKLMGYYADLIYKGFIVHNRHIEDVLETLEPNKVIESWKEMK